MPTQRAQSSMVKQPALRHRARTIHHRMASLGPDAMTYAGQTSTSNSEPGEDPISLHTDGSVGAGQAR